MKLDADKCSVSLFSMSPRDACMSELRVRLFGNEVARERTPCFLGVTFDSKLLFQADVDSIIAKARKRVNVLRKLAGVAWGWSKSMMRSTYVALIRSVLLYGVSAWGPWLCASGWLRLERVQLEAGRVICGMLKSAPSEAVLAECGLVELRRVAEVRWVLELDKCKRVSEDDPRFNWDLTSVRKRLKRDDWRGPAGRLENVWVPEGVGRCRRAVCVAQGLTGRMSRGLWMGGGGVLLVRIGCMV